MAHYNSSAHPLFTFSRWTSPGKKALDESMKRVVFGLVLILIGMCLGFGIAKLFPQGTPQAKPSAPETITFTISAHIDGSERFIFTRDNVWNEHGRWQPATEVLFNGEPWTDLAVPPEQWDKIAPQLDLTKAELLQRKGRDIIALERTPDGFDLYFADTQMGAAPYEATIVIPKK
jgi:hypothetical protein